LQTTIEKLSQREVFMPMSFNSLRRIFQPLISKIEKLDPVIIIIAGTNGKGETAHNLQRMALTSKYKKRVSMWTSPHIESYAERFSFNGVNILQSELEHSLSCFESLFPHNSCHLSFYELSFWLFCHQVIKQKSDFIILEVGLGGRLDAVNLFDADHVILTSISRDHTEYLGNFYREIVPEKLGVLRKKSKLVYSVQTDYIDKLICKIAHEKKLDAPIKLQTTGEFSNYRKRNWELAKITYEAVTAEECPLSFDPFFTTLGRGNEKVIEGLRLNFFNAHNIDAHREFLRSINPPRNSALILFFSNRPSGEIKGILKLYSKFYKGKIIIAGVDEHFKIISVVDLKVICGEGWDYVDFSNTKIASEQLKFYGHSNFFVSGTNYIQCLLKDSVIG